MQPSLPSSFRTFLSPTKLSGTPFAANSPFPIHPQAAPENDLFFSKNANKDFGDAQSQDIYNGITKINPWRDICANNCTYNTLFPKDYF